MRAFISVVLVSLLLKTQLLAQQSPADLRNRIANFPPESLVEVRTKSGEKLRGHIVGRTDSDFSLRQGRGAATKTIAYEQVLAVSRVGVHTRRKWIIIGVVAGIVLWAAIYVYTGLTRD